VKADLLENLVRRMPELLHAFPGPSHPVFIRKQLSDLNWRFVEEASLTKEAFEVIAQGKLTGQSLDRTRDALSQDHVAGSRESFDHARRHEHDLALSRLMELKGVGASLASAILSWAFCPRSFPVIDRHSWRAYCCLVNPSEKTNTAGSSPSFSASAYSRYRKKLLSALKGLPPSLGFDVSNLDYWLFAFSKTFGKGSLGCDHWADHACVSFGIQGGRHA